MKTNNIELVWRVEAGQAVADCWIRNSEQSRSGTGLKIRFSQAAYAAEWEVKELAAFLVAREGWLDKSSNRWAGPLSVTVTVDKISSEVAPYQECMEQLAHEGQCPGYTEVVADIKISGGQRSPAETTIVRKDITYC
jgi:hypothetical protein